MANYDEKTGIRFGVISPHSISQYALDDIYTNGTDTNCESGKQELLDDLKQFCEDHGLNFDRINTDSFEDQYYEHYENQDGQMDYSDNEYDLHVSGDNFGIFVMKSPYYTYCRGCSPCAPGAGDLDHPVDMDDIDRKMPNMYNVFSPDNHEKTLCLGPEWFNKESPIPYRVFRVDNDQEVI